jgi:hypothetical protein
MRKLQVRNRVEAAIYASQRANVQPPIQAVGGRQGAPLAPAAPIIIAEVERPELAMARLRNSSVKKAAAAQAPDDVNAHVEMAGRNERDSRLDAKHDFLTSPDGGENN